MGQIVSHGAREISFEAEFVKLQEAAKALGPTHLSSVEERLELLQQLASFDFGRFLILNRGINGYWTDYVCTAKESDRHTKSELEGFLLFDRPLALATRERYRRFQKLAQKELFSGIKICSVPSGLMSDVLTLNYEGISNYELTAIDLDQESLQGAYQVAKENGVSDHFKAICRDAWNMGIAECFDVILSSGLNIYVAEDDRVRALYKEFFRALRPGGTLVVSYLETNRNAAGDCNRKNERKQHVIYKEILEFTGSKVRSHSETIDHLSAAGFVEFETFADRFRIFPTVRAKRPC